MAEQVCADDDIPAGDVLALIAALVDKSLVVLEPEVLGQARYRMLDTIREYAAALLADAGESARFSSRSATTCCGPRSTTWRSGWRRSRSRGRPGSTAPAGTSSTRATWPRSWRGAWPTATWRPGCGSASRSARAGSCWGTFAEGGEWLDSFLALGTSALSPRIRGAALVARAQLAASSDPAARRAWPRRDWSCAATAATGSGPRCALNLLSEIALQTGRAAEAAASANQALADRAGRRRRLERGLRAGHQGRDRGPGGPAASRPTSWPSPRSA